MNSEEILKAFNLKRTKCRKGILDMMIDTNQALSENEIREKMSKDYDRTTFYRSFKTLEENHIIHKIVVDNQFVKYAYNSSITKDKAHVHFFCIDCQTVRCIDTESEYRFKLPEGFQDEETEILIKGTCAKCKH
ncbi:MAG: transcriptional repressor [Paludibacteraceae bacterium]